MKKSLQEFVTEWVNYILPQASECWKMCLYSERNT